MREHGTKTTPIFLPADGEASLSLLPSSVSLLLGGTVQPENTYSRILKVPGQVWESQKRSINTNHSYHQLSTKGFIATLHKYVKSKVPVKLRYLFVFMKDRFHISLLTHFQPMLHFYTPWKHQKTYGDVFKGYRSWTLGENGLKVKYGIDLL